MSKLIASILLENSKAIKVELYPEIAPNTVNYFICLVKQEYYNDVLFHRIGRFSHIQAGYPLNTDRINNIIISEGDSPTSKIKLERGVISMIRNAKTNTLGTQFFIVTNTPLLKDNYEASFGRVVEGMEEVDRISKVQVDENMKPIRNELIKTIKIED
jgi:peptidyl-prolyl cis-trans isomerase B (cyclophilin B)